MKPPTLPKLSCPLLTVACPPHAHCGRTVRGLMLETLLALTPALILAAYTFHMPALRVTGLCAAVAVLTEWACWKLIKRPAEIDDFHALLVGVLFAFLLPASAPWWMAAVGSAASIILGKMIYGGLGGTPFCAPALGWAVCTLSWPAFMDTNLSLLGFDLPAPLHDLLHFGPASVANTDLMGLFLGRQVGGLGAVQVAAVALGGLYLIARRRLDWRIPLGFLAGTALAALPFQVLGLTAGPLLHLLSGSTVFAAFFLATDPASTPSGRLSMLLFGFIAGALVVVIRVYGIYPDATPFAVLLTNLFTPLLDRIGPRPFGVAPKRAKQGGA